MVSSAYLAPYLPLLLTAGGLAALSVSYWAILFPRIAISLLAVSLTLGQLVRLPLPGQGGGLLVSDVAVILTLGAALIQFLRNWHPQVTHWSLVKILSKRVARREGSPRGNSGRIPSALKAEGKPELNAGVRGYLSGSGPATCIFSPSFK